MSTLKGIFEPFKLFVVNQLNLRKKIVGGHLLSKPELYHTYTRSKQAVIRMSSGVNVKEDNSLLNEVDEFEKSLVGSKLAENWILDGGIKILESIVMNEGATQETVAKDAFGKTLTIDLSTTFHEFTERGGIGDNGVYGDPKVRADSDEEFGMVPMPGIIDAEIRTKSDDGSLREAQVNFVCHNRRQLEILETLYMRPGYPILLEWGWNPYIATGEEGEGVIENFNNIQPLTEFFQQGSDLTKINQRIAEIKKETDGNYDGFVGNCKNFSFSANESGGYNCTTEIMAHGEILESLKSAKISVPTSLTYDSKGYDVEVIDQYLFYLKAIKANLDRAGDNKYINLKGTPLDETSMWDSKAAFFGEVLWAGDGSMGTTWLNTQEEDINKGIANKNLKSSQITLERINVAYVQGFSLITSLVQKIMKVSEEDMKKEMDVDPRDPTLGYDSMLYGTFLQETSAVLNKRAENNKEGVTKKEKSIYVRWDMMCQIINHLCTPSYKRHHEPMVELTYLNPLQRSYDSTTPHAKKKSKNEIEGTEKFYLDYSLPSKNKLHPAVDNENLKKLLGQSFDYGVCIMPHQFPDSLIVSKYDSDYQTTQQREAEQAAEKAAEQAAAEELAAVEAARTEAITNQVSTANTMMFEDPGAGETSGNINANVYADESVRGGKITKANYIPEKVEVDITDTKEFKKDQGNEEENFQPLTSYNNVKFSNKSIGLVYFNLDYLISEYESMRLETKTVNDKKVTRLKEKFSFFEFIEKIWKDVSISCGGYYDFGLQTEHERPHVARVIDKTVSGNPPSNIFEFEPQGRNSITRDFNFSSKISSDMADIISIAAQAPKNAQSLDAMSFKAFHKNIKNRFTTDELLYETFSARRKADKQEAEVAKIELERDLVEYGKMLQNLKKYQKHSNNQRRDPLPEDAAGSYNASNIAADAAIEIAKEIEGLLIKINLRYPLYKKDGKTRHKKAGQFNPDATNERSAIIPLEFNLQMDGIAGISPLNLFKINPDKLPYGYQREDIAFIVKGESQKITAGQDWTTELNGQLTLLNTNTEDEGTNKIGDVSKPKEEVKKKEDKTKKLDEKKADEIKSETIKDSARDINEAQKITSLDSSLQGPIKRVLKAIRAKGWKAKIHYAHRSIQEQKVILKKGHSTVPFSYHNTYKNDVPAALAVDMIDKRWAWKTPGGTDHQYWKDLGAACKAEGLTWGGDWKSFKDVAHCEMKGTTLAKARAQSDSSLGQKEKDWIDYILALKKKHKSKWKANWDKTKYF